MLQKIREKTSGWFASIILGLIILTMAFFGIETYLQPEVQNFAAKIEGPPKFLNFGRAKHEIGVEEFRQRFASLREQQRRAQGDAFNAVEFESMENKRRVLDELIDEAVLKLVAERDGVVVPDSAIRKAILGVEAFQQNGKFDAQQYQLTLQRQQPPLSPQQFEQRIREDLQRQVLPLEVTASAFASEEEIDTFLRLSRQTRDLRLLDIPPPSLPAAPPSEAEIAEWYRKNAATYRSEEQVAIEYVELDAAALPVQLVADEAALRQRYEQEKARFGVSEQRFASHILVKLDEKANQAAVDAALAKARDIAAKARAGGADFAALAKQYSDDLGSRDGGGDLGAVDKGLFGDAFDAAFFALQPGQISDPVRLSDGWHVIWYRELVRGSGKPFEEVRAQLEAEYLEGERERRFNEISGKLVDKVYADPNSLAAASRELGLTVYRAGPFGRNAGTGVAALEPVRKAAFAEAQKLERLVSDPIEVGANHVVVLHVTEHRPATAIALAQVRDRVLADLNADRLAKASQDRAEALLARAREGESLETLAAEVSRTLAEMPGVSREWAGTRLPPAVVNDAFRQPRPADGKPSFALAKLAPDRYALIAVIKATDGDLAGIDAETRKRLREQLARLRGSQDSRALLQTLRKQFEIKVEESRL
jgi:peptidyl-prolyl cis-trans isomerase D